MSRAYKLVPTPDDHSIFDRPFFHEIAEELAKFEAPLLKDLEAIEEFLRRKKHEPAPPPPAPGPGPAPSEPVDMLPLLQDTEDQGQQGSCFAFAGTHAQNLCEALVLGAPQPVKYSPACLSWNTRSIMGTTNQDSGGNLGDAITAQEQVGTCIEDVMPYNQYVFDVPPDTEAITNEALHRAGFKAYPLDFSKPENIDSALAAGYPIFFGFYVWGGFEKTASDGTMSMPDGSNLGGHAQLAYYTPVPASVPYPAWPAQNSWDKTFGLLGREWFPKEAISTIMDGFVLVPHGG